MWRLSAMPLTLRELWRRCESPVLPHRLRDVSWRTHQRNKALAEAEKRFHGHRFCLLVHHQCTPKDLVTAYLIMYTAILRHSTTEAELRAFIKECNTEQNVWRAKGGTLYKHLGEVGWDVKSPALDHHDLRVSQLLVRFTVLDAEKASSASPGVPEE